MAAERNTLLRVPGCAGEKRRDGAGGGMGVRRCRMGPDEGLRSGIEPPDLVPGAPIGAAPENAEIGMAVAIEIHQLDMAGF